jgi:hypothetical protein
MNSSDASEKGWMIPWRSGIQEIGIGCITMF